MTAAVLTFDEKAAVILRARHLITTLGERAAAARIVDEDGWWRMGHSDEDRADLDAARAVVASGCGQHVQDAANRIAEAEGLDVAKVYVLLMARWRNLPYPQYDGDFTSERWEFGPAHRECTTKGGLTFRRGDMVLWREVERFGTTDRVVYSNLRGGFVVTRRGDIGDIGPLWRR